MNWHGVSGVLATLFAAAAVGGVSYAIAQDSENPPADSVPAEECPEASAVFKDAGIEIATFAVPCPTAEEARQAASRQASAEDTVVDIRERTMSALETALRKAQQDELRASIPPSEAIPVLEALISFEQDDTINPSEQKVLDGGRANEVLGELKAAGDFPTDMTSP